MNRSENALLYLLVVTSLLVHLVAALVIRTERLEKKKEKEPIVVDIAGPLKQAPETRLPPPDPKPSPAPLTPEPKKPPKVAKSMPLRPSVPSIPIPARPPAPQPSPEPPAPPPPTRLPSGPYGTPTTSQPSAPAPRAEPSPPSPESGGRPAGGRTPDNPDKIKMPTIEDLKRYAKVDKESLKPKDDQSITLDTDDLKYASYMQGLKRRIELVWKYPETARRDGIQGSLVMRFSIAKSGKVDRVDVLESSGYPMLDEAAKRALMDASPFNPLPDNWNKESFTITGTFIYRLYGMYLR